MGLIHLEDKNERRALWLLVGALLVGALFNYLTSRPKAPVGTLSKPAPVAAAAKLPTEKIPLKAGLRVVNQDAAVKKLPILREELEDGTRHLTTTATLAKSKGGYDVYSVTNDAGDTKLLTVAKPPALFALEHAGRVGIGAGLDSRHGQTAKALVEYTPLTVFGVTVGVEGQARFHPASPDAVVGYYGGVLAYKEFGR